MDHQIELGAESLDGEIANNPLYQLAEEHHLVDIDDSKNKVGLFLEYSNKKISRQMILFFHKYLSLKHLLIFFLFDVIIIFFRLDNN